MYSYDRRTAAVDLSTPDKAGDFLRSKLSTMFPQHYVNVWAERGVGIEVGHFSEDDYAREQMRSGYRMPPNLLVKIVIAPSRFGSGAWADLNVNPAADNPELKEAGITPIRKAGGLTPDKAVAMVVKWFEKNQKALSL